MGQNNIDFQNRELPTNILALLLVTTRRHADGSRHPDASVPPKADQPHSTSDAGAAGAVPRRQVVTV